MQPRGKFKTILEIQFTKSVGKYITEVIFVFYIKQFEWDIQMLRRKFIHFYKVFPISLSIILSDISNIYTI